MFAIRYSPLANRYSLFATRHSLPFLALTGGSCSRTTDIFRHGRSRALQSKSTVSRVELLLSFEPFVHFCCKGSEGFQDRFVVVPRNSYCQPRFADAEKELLLHSVPSRRDR